jgi:ABC-type glycerol-3-phosphate transport system substrate-binding protein
MKNKLSVLFGLLLIASMVLAACGGAAATEEAPAALRLRPKLRLPNPSK